MKNILDSAPLNKDLATLLSCYDKFKKRDEFFEYLSSSDSVGKAVILSLKESLGLHPKKYGNISVINTYCKKYDFIIFFFDEKELFLGAYFYDFCSKIAGMIESEYLWYSSLSNDQMSHFYRHLLWMKNNLVLSQNNINKN
ncbi:MAG TPA: hypothetical protein VIK14_11895 [Ignavibacteria bacterium]